MPNRAKRATVDREFLGGDQTEMVLRETEFLGTGEAPGAKDCRASGQASAQERGRGRVVGGAREAKKSTWETLTGAWLPHDIRDQVVDYVRYWSDRTETPTKQLVQWIGLSQSKFYDWRKRYGKANEHNGWIPRDWWLEDWEKQAIAEFHDQNPLEGYRRLTFMMLDADVVAASPSSAYRVLSDAGLMKRHNTKASLKGTGFQQPLGPHEHWHVNIAYINVRGTFFFRLLSRICG